MILNTGWDYLNAAFVGIDLEQDDMTNYNPFFMNRLLSFHPSFRELAHEINRWYFISDKLKHYRMVLGFLKNKKCFIKYEKVGKKPEITKSYESLADGCKMLFGWSRRELGKNLWYMDRESKVFLDLCSSVGLSDREIKALQKE
jgi:hypothetical protein